MKNNENIFVKIIAWAMNNILWELITFGFSLFITGGITFYNLDFLGIMDKYNKAVSILIYFFLLFGVLSFFIFIFKIIYRSDKLLPLAEARTEGVILRNKGEDLYDEEDAKLWIEEFDKWDKDTITKISRISKVKAEYFKVINRFELHRGEIWSKAIIHNKKLNVLEEKLRRLELLIIEFENKRKS